MGYVGFLISDALNKIIFDVLEVLRNIQFTAEEREALRIKYDLSDKEFEEKRKEWDERERLLKEQWEKEDEKLKEQDEDQNAIKYSAISKIHEKFYKTVDDLEFNRQFSR